MMETISKSAMTFINAAGELFAAHGIDGVSIRAIAEAAGIDSSMIKYHFGSKDGLVNAVVEYAVAPWKKDNLQSYYRENESLLATRDGQVVFVSGMVETVFRIFQSGGEEPWRKSFLLQLIQRPHPLRQKIIDRHIRPGIDTFLKVYRKITGNEDFESAFCWYLFLICPMFMCSGSPDMINLFHPKGEISNGFVPRLRLFTTQQLLLGFHLC